MRFLLVQFTGAQTLPSATRTTASSISAETIAKKNHSHKRSGFRDTRYYEIGVERHIAAFQDDLTEAIKQKLASDSLRTTRAMKFSMLADSVAIRAKAKRHKLKVRKAILFALTVSSSCEFLEQP